MIVINYVIISNFKYSQMLHFLFNELLEKFRISILLRNANYVKVIGRSKRVTQRSLFKRCEAILNYILQYIFAESMNSVYQNVKTF